MMAGVKSSQRITARYSVPEPHPESFCQQKAAFQVYSIKWKKLTPLPSLVLFKKLRCQLIAYSFRIAGTPLPGAHTLPRRSTTGST